MIFLPTPSNFREMLPFSVDAAGLVLDRTGTSLGKISDFAMVFFPSFVGHSGLVPRRRGWPVFCSCGLLGLSVCQGLSLTPRGLWGTGFFRWKSAWLGVRWILSMPPLPVQHSDIIGSGTPASRLQTRRFGDHDGKSQCLCPGNMPNNSRGIFSGPADPRYCAV